MHDKTPIGNIKDIGSRIELERIRLKKKYTAVAYILHIHSNTYRNYEFGKRDMPISLLAKLQQIGFDSMYILTGERNHQNTGVEKSSKCLKDVLSDADTRKLKTLADTHNKLESSEQRELVSLQMDKILGKK